MNCKEFKNIIADYLGQNLNSDHEKQFAEHLQKCSECSLLFEKTNKTLSFLDNPERIPEQAFYFTQLKQKMENRFTINESFLHTILTKKVLQPLLYLASIIIAVYIGILIGSGTPNSNKYSEISKTDTSYIELFAQYQYINEMELESIERNLVAEETIETTNKK
ncbi:MAG: hypothetical protein A2W99_01490 [Bacteroidetes bacterium GWF2_33_16]|nr:MAG: hypothetical protein A2X00_16665 [Bacteroidetes bacterium GWE2_32_14]OFY06945.1 MAG: hypothetical protein A2W99_01490 [Bacteroidetes bacterium GWF2_33_16]